MKTKNLIVKFNQNIFYIIKKKCLLMSYEKVHL